MDIARGHDLLVIKDAAQGVLAGYNARPLGGIGHMAALSFHETKNIIAGEGGALLINDPRFVDRAEVAWEKGTNRSQFFRGQADKYTWVDLGSSYLPGEIIAAFLWAQMEEADGIPARRLGIWADYHESFVDLERTGDVRRPVVPGECTRTGHMSHLLMPSLERPTAFRRQPHRVRRGRTPSTVRPSRPPPPAPPWHGHRRGPRRPSPTSRRTTGPPGSRTG